MGACHGNLSGKGGFRLSLRGEDPEFDHATLTRDQLGRRIDTLDPERSLIVLKPTGGIAHEGGQRFHRRSIEAETLIRWIAAGARDDRALAVPLRASGSSRPIGSWLPGTSDQQLIVTAELADGSTRDVTRQAAYDVGDPSRFAVSVERAGARTRAGRGGDRRPISERSGDQPAGVPRRPPGIRVARRRGRASCRQGRVRQAPGDPDQSLAAGRRSGLRPPGVSRRHRPPARSRRDPRLPVRPGSPEAEQAGRSPGRPPRVRRLLGAQVGRRAAQRGEDHGREGRLGLPSMAARRARPRRPAG